MRSVYVEAGVFDNYPINWKTQCQHDGNVKWDNYKPILESNPPPGALSCVFYPRVIGSLYGSRFDISLKQQPLGAEAIFNVNGIETRRSTVMSADGGEPVRIELSIPWTAGIFAAKLVEFLDNLIILIGLYLFVPYLVKTRWSMIKTAFSKEYSWKSLFFTTFVCILTYSILEWLFIITKPSFLSAVDQFQKFKSFLVAESFFSVFVFGILLLFFLISRVPGLSRYSRFIKGICQIFPAFFAAALAILLIDNFTYTIFNWGIVTSEGYYRAVYILVFLLIYLAVYAWTGESLAWWDTHFTPRGMNRFVLPILIALLLVVLGLSNQTRMTAGAIELAAQQTSNRELPDILLLTGDGINTTQTSIFDPVRETTPRIAELAAKSLVAENAFTNAGNTAGSIISIYTGKYPTDTRLLYPPDILRGEDSYQHLPGILKSLGYYTAEFAAPHNADAYDQNLISGFDIANGRSVQNNLLFSQLNHFLQTNDAYLVYEMLNRLFDRLGHIFYLSNMTNDQALVEGEAQKYDDQSKITGVIDILQKTDQPVFAHIHWMGTHAGRYTPEDENDETNNDENIREFDAGVGQIIDELIRSKKLDNTILIVSTDHARMYFTTKRIPFLIHFPDDEFASRFQSNVQLLDIAPTLLDYLGIAKPVWMEGDSLLQGELPERVIFGVGVPNEIRDTGFVAKEYMKPPFYQFGYISVVYCSSWYRFSFEDYQMMSGEIQGYINPCPQEDKVTEQKVYEWMNQHLNDKGFEVDLQKLASEKDPNN
ncbi:MAG: sulfatase-like hydrolase/transferase [Anaerolineaceae bacterium]